MSIITLGVRVTCMSLLAVTVYGQSYSLDPVFGSGGKATINFPTSATTDVLGALALQPDGNIVLAGLNNNSFGIGRLTATGQPDPAFGVGGVVATPVVVNNSGTTTTSATPAAMLLQADGRIVVGGAVRTNALTWRAYVRYLANGTLDVSFGAGNPYGAPGIYIPYQGSGGLSSFILALHQQTDGKLLSVGYANQLTGNTIPQITRLSANGSLDNTYSSIYPSGIGYGTIVTTATPYSSVLDNSGRLLTAGLHTVANMNYTGPNGAAVIRYLSDGSFDSSFGTNGISVLSPAASGPSITWTKMLYQPDNKVVVAGLQRRFSGTSVLYDTLALACYDSNGALDASFGKRGVLKVASGTTSASPIFGLKRLSTGEIVVGIKLTDVSSDTNFRVMRLTAASPASTTPPSPISITGFSPVDMAVQQDDKLLVAGTQTGANGTKNYAAVRFAYSAALSARISLASGAISLYPNPASHTITLRLSGAAGAVPVAIRMLNSLGQELVTYPIVQPVGGALQLPLPAVAPGVYTLILQGTGFVASQKFTKID